MSKTIENVKTLNSLARTGIMIVFLGFVGYGGWLTYAYLIKPRIESQMALEKANQELTQIKQQVDEQLVQIEKQTKQINELNLANQELVAANEKLELANRLLKVDHRLAHVKVLQVGEDEQTKMPFTRVEFKEVDEEGHQIGETKEFKLAGRQIHVSGWIVKFQDKFIEEADLHRGTSLFMFRSIFGEHQTPASGYSLEEKWTRPEAYARGSKLSDFERQIWDNFWTLANSREKSEGLGIRDLGGETKFIQAEEGKVYEVSLRASGGLNFGLAKQTDKKSVDQVEPKSEQPLESKTEAKAPAAVISTQR